MIPKLAVSAKAVGRYQQLVGEWLSEADLPFRNIRESLVLPLHL